MLQSLQDMAHYVTTAHGISKHSYGCQRLHNKPVQGSGQGNGASPTIWTLISSPLLSMMRTLGYGVEFSSPISQESTHFVGCSFVDDTDLLQTHTRYDKLLIELQTTMQEAIDAWSTGLRATGGSLVPSKSWIYPISFQFNKKGHFQYTPIDLLDLQFTVHDYNQNRQNLSQIGASIARETLGVFLAPDGNERARIEYL